MTLKELYRLFYENNLRISTDTRKISTGDIFFALRGDNFDGNKFVNEAIIKGASFIVCENSEALSEQVICVNDSTKALQEFASMHRDNLKIPIVAITGSNGKTTTKELLREVLSKKFKVLASPASFNNHIGVPLTILDIKPEYEIAVIEMGDNHEGEIEELCKIARPTHGLITNIGRDHIGEAGGLEANVRAKLELYKYFKKSGGVNFLNKEDALLVENSQDLENVNYVNGEVLNREQFLVIKIEESNINTKFIGDYNLDNFRAAFTIGKFFGVEKDDIVFALENYEPKDNRSQKVITKKNEIILDAYNANPDSMRLALENFSKIKTDKNKIVILGDMFEMGSFAGEVHREIIELTNFLNFKEIYFIGKEFNLNKDLSKDNKFFQTTDAFTQYLKENKIENSFILVKGSRGMALEKILKEDLL